jgi:hypothetical protein
VLEPQLANVLEHLLVALVQTVEDADGRGARLQALLGLTVA